MPVSHDIKATLFLFQWVDFEMHGKNLQMDLCPIFRAQTLSLEMLFLHLGLKP